MGIWFNKKEKPVVTGSLWYGSSGGGGGGWWPGGAGLVEH